MSPPGSLGCSMSPPLSSCSGQENEGPPQVTGQGGEGAGGDGRIRGGWKEQGQEGVRGDRNSRGWKELAEGGSRMERCDTTCPQPLGHKFPAPRRSSFGTEGRPISLRANHLEVPGNCLMSAGQIPVMLSYPQVSVRPGYIYLYRYRALYIVPVYCICALYLCTVLVRST